jgi:hypothetical protein
MLPTGAISLMVVFISSVALATVESFLAASPMQAPILLLLALDSFAAAATDVVFPDIVFRF